MATDAVVTPIKSKNTGAVSFLPSEKSQEGLLKYFLEAAGFLNNNYNIRNQLERRDRAYYREKDLSSANLRARWANEAGDPRAIQNITIPVVMPQVESVVSYLSDIFLTGYPIFPVLSKPQIAPAALQMETLIGEHSVKWGWVAELMLSIRDGLKYNLMAAEVAWKDQKIWTIDTDPAATGTAGRSTETYYQGNCIKRIDPYNLILDTRVAIPSDMHKKGEFAGWTELMSRIQLMMLFADIGGTATMNATKAYESGPGLYATGGGAPTDAFYIPQINPWSFNDGRKLSSTNWLNWAGLEKADGIKYNDMYEVTTLYCRIVPSDFMLSVQGRNTVQIWKLIVVNRKVIIHCERQTNAHNYLGVIVAQPNEDGLGWQSKSFGENATPHQDAATALFNSALESQRRKVYDRMLYDPSRINKKDIDDVSPVARIPVKQVAYGQSLELAVHTLPYHDEGIAEILGMSREVAEQANIANGQNRAQQGQFQKGNKSRKEFDTVMGNANGRNQIMAILLEYKFFQPIKEIIKLNILQYQPPTTLYNRNIKESVDIKPEEIRKAALEFRLSDGLLPVDKMINLEAIGTVMQMTAANPASAAEWDLTGMMMFGLQMQGASWIGDFHRTADQQKAFIQNMQATSGATNGAGNPVSPAATTS